MKIIDGGKGKGGWSSFSESMLSFGDEPDENQNFMIGMAVGAARERITDALGECGFEISQWRPVSIIAPYAARAKFLKLSTWAKVELTAMHLETGNLIPEDAVDPPKIAIFLFQAKPVSITLVK